MSPPSPAAAILIGVIRAYQRWISPFFLPRCRFYPSCSSYAVQALASRGVVVGAALALGRLLRCQPFSAGGIDPVPVRGSGRGSRGKPHTGGSSRTEGHTISTASPGAPS